MPPNDPLRRAALAAAKAMKALADKADATGDCDHKRASCAEVGCIGEQVKAVRLTRAALLAELAREPAGFAAFYVVPEQRDRAGVVKIDLGDGRVRWAVDWMVGSPDEAWWRALPRAAEEELAEYYRAVTAGEVEDRTRGDDLPCLWYDAATGRCRHYEQRPEVCRDAIQPGDEACLAARERHFIPLPTVPA